MPDGSTAVLFVNVTGDRGWKGMRQGMRKGKRCIRSSREDRRGDNWLEKLHSAWPLFRAMWQHQSQKKKKKTQQQTNQSTTNPQQNPTQQMLWKRTLLMQYYRTRTDNTLKLIFSGKQFSARASKLFSALRYGWSSCTAPQELLLWVQNRGRVGLKWWTGGA